jgi:hypothetical protein
LVTIHEAAARGLNFGQASAAWLRLRDATSGSELAYFDAGTAGRSEAALILGELYRRGGEWKFRAVGQGFAGGLGPLARHFGVDVEQSAPPPVAAVPQPTAQPADRRVSLDKRIVDLSKKDPGLVSLVKKVRVELEKKNLAQERAKVALALDISASMNGFYRSGSIATLVARVLAFGFNLDDDGQIDVFLFGSGAHVYGPVGVDSYRDFVPTMLRRHPLESSTSYGAVMGALRRHYQQQPGFGSQPVYVMFVTDGDTTDKARTEQEIRAAAGEPLFWQFMAIGKKRSGLLGKLSGAGFDFLEKLDDLPGRMVDNADFFLVEDPAAMSEEELYRLLTTEYPNWLRLVREKGILRP